MADTIRDRATLIASMADNTTGLLTAQVERDFLVSVMGVYGSLWTDDAAAIETIQTSGTKLTSFVNAGVSSGMTCSASGDSITVTTSGVYDIGFNVGISGTGNNVDFSFYVYVNNVKKSEIGSHVRMSESTDKRTVSASGQVTLAVNDVITLWALTVSGPNNLVIVDSNLNCKRIG
jgi:hypothetical protein